MTEPETIIENIVRLGGSASKLHLLLLLAAVNMDEQALTHLKALLESMVYYSTVNQIKTNELERLYAQWCKQIREIHTDEELTSFINNKIKPTISQWKVNNRSNFMRIGFDSMQQYRVKFILARITKYVDVRRKNGGDASNVAEFYEGGIEIEHIMPQKYSAAYGISEDDYNAAKQRLGNLTLLEKRSTHLLVTMPLQVNRKRTDSQHII